MTFWVTFWLWVASFVITDYFRQRLPSQTPSGIGDFSVPTATEGRFVPLCFGTMAIEGPNVIWYGDFSYQDLTVETGIIFKDDETVGYKYFLGLQLCLMRGQCAGLRRIWIGDDVVWDYIDDNGGNLGSVCDVNKPALFGGEKEGGGFVGRFRLYDGTQLAVSPYLATQVAADVLSAYKGFSYLVVTNLTEDGGAEIGESNTLRRMKFEIQTFDTVANGALGDSFGLANNHHFIGDDLNPVVLAWDVFTNTDWGRGLSISELNQANFETTAETIWNEGYGFSMVVDQVTTSKELLDLIEQHIDGYIGPNPITGQIEINLARQDYTLASEFQLDETNVINVSKFSRGENNQTFNEVRVQYLDRAKNYGDTYAPAQDLANLAIQGRRRSRINRMPGVHTASVANKIAWRDLRGASRTLASATIEVDRTAWSLRPGDIVSLTDAEVGVTNLACRITSVRQGDPLNASVLLDVVEDVFGNEVAGFPAPPDSQFTPPSLAVAPLLATDGWSIDAPKRFIDEDAAVGTGSSAYPRVLTAIKPGVGGSATLFDHRVDAPKNGISPEFPSVGTFSGGMTYGVLASSLGGWAAGNGTFTVSVVPAGSPIVAGDLDSLIGTYLPGGYNHLDGLCVINPGGANEEWIVCDTIVDGGAGITLQNVWRGALDTIMESHSAGEEIWFIWTGGLAFSADSYAAGQNFEVKVLPSSNTESVGLYDSPLPPSIADSTFDNPARASRPPPIISLSLNSIPFPTGNVDFDAILATSPEVQGVSGTTLFKPFNLAANILLQVQGYKESGVIMQSADFTDENWTVEWWLFDLDATPSPVRGSPADQIASSGGPLPVTQQNHQILITKNELSPTPVTNSFNARIELQVKFDPTSSGTPIVARDDLIFDFTAVGTWVVPPTSIWLDLNITGELGSRYIRDRSDANWPLYYSGWSDGGLLATPPANSPGWDGSEAYDLDSTVARGGYLVLKDMLHHPLGRNWDIRNDWTVEFTLSHKNNLEDYIVLAVYDQSADAINGQYDVSGWVSTNWFGITYSATNDKWGIYLSRNGTSMYSFYPCHENTHIPATSNGQTDHVMITQKDNGNGTKTYNTFINGSSLGRVTHALSGATDFYDFFGESPLRSDVDLSIFGGRNIWNYTGSGNFKGYIDRVRVTAGYALEAVDHVSTKGEFERIGTVSFHWGGYPDNGQQVDTTTDGLEVLATWGGGSRPTNEAEKFAGVPVLYCDGTDSTTDTSIGSPFFGTTNLNEPHDKSCFLNKEDFTLEAFVYFLALPSTKSGGMAIIAKGAEFFDPADFCLFVDTNHRLTCRLHRNGSYLTFYDLVEDAPASPWPQSPIDGSISPSPIVTGKWYHFAACREGDALSLFKDGVRVAYDDDFFSTLFAGFPVGNSGSRYPVRVGAYYRGSPAVDSRCLNGYVSEPRILKGEAAYSGTTYTVPTAPFEAIRGKALPARTDKFIDHCELFLRFNDQGGSPHNPYLKDESGKDYDIRILSTTATINTSVQKYGTGCLELLNGSPAASNPPAYAYSALSTNDNWLYQEDGGTTELWVRFNTLPGTGQLMVFVAQWNENSEQGWRLGYSGDDGWTFSLSQRITATARNFSYKPSPEPQTNTWYHMRVSVLGGNIRMWIDGVLVLSDAWHYYNAAINISETLYIGCDINGSTRRNGFDGWIDELTIYRGTVLNRGNWEADFTPAENFFPDITFQFGTLFTNWPLQEGFKNVQMSDMSVWNNTFNTYYATAVCSLHPGLLRPGGRDYFVNHSQNSSYWYFNPGTGVSPSNNSLGSENFTIEMWFAWASAAHLTTSAQSLLGQNYTSGSNRQWAITYRGTSVGGISPDITDNSICFDWYPLSSSGASGQYRTLGVKWEESPDLWAWHHIALVHENGILQLYIDGILKPWGWFRNWTTSTTTVAASPNGSEFGTIESPYGIWSNGGIHTTVGAFQQSTQYANILVEDVRITRSRALYSGASFTPPAPFPRMSTFE